MADRRFSATKLMKIHYTKHINSKNIEIDQLKKVSLFD